MPTVKDAAKFLEVSERQVYEMCHEGVLRHWRPTPHIIRIDQDVLEEYKKSCQSHGTKKKAVGASSSVVLSTEKSSRLRDFFLKAGRDPERKHTTGKKRRGSTLRLAVSNSLGD